MEDVDPLSYSSSVSGRKDSCQWIAVIAKELEMMKNLEVWDVVDLEPHHKVVGTTWVFRRKKNPINQTKYKVQLCAQGFAQTLGEDYSKTFSPTGKMHSLRTLIAFFVTNGLKFQQLDIRSAFLNAKLEESAIYGIKQAPLAWYNRLTAWLKNTGFTALLSNPCVFYHAKNSPIWLFFHIDDIAVFGKDVEPLKNQLKSEFDVKDMGNAEVMLGIQMIQALEGLVLSQAHYIKSVLVLYGMENCRPVATPMVPGIHLTEASLDQQVAFKKLGVNYRSTIGSLSYLSTVTRPDILFSTRRSVTGFIVTFNGCLVIWKTRKQPTVSLSTAEAEYKALTDLSAELLWLRKFIQELALHQVEGPIYVFSNNQACINTANSDSNCNNWRMKHVEIQLHFIREVISQKCWNAELKVAFH
ncbi:hypothetical protein O181_016369 [Austropuccinia psidii MF-1]|uniref:Reverse transcriptase Ty1/copia-type domain-containing protein n=1 Tax=Austropuccinia psidii MF-1 TaxID=1389203 RepID=A0A9Q3C1K5_9BASI|nr:hypothetical protein [Austropuccinia psidii MF-1]